MVALIVTIVSVLKVQHRIWDSLQLYQVTLPPTLEGGPLRSRSRCPLKHNGNTVKTHGVHFNLGLILNLQKTPFTRQQLPI